MAAIAEDESDLYGSKGFEGRVNQPVADVFSWRFKVGKTVGKTSVIRFRGFLPGVV